MLSRGVEWWIHWRHRVLGGALFALAFGVTIYTAVASSRKQPPSGELSASLVVLAGLLQVGSAAMFAKSGKPDDTHAAASVRRLVQLAVRTQELSQSVAHAKGQDVATMRTALTDLSARLNYLAADSFDMIEDWTSFNHAADRQVQKMNDIAAATIQTSAEPDEDGNGETR